jgi:hypothetical protein
MSETREGTVASIVQYGVLHADMWAMDNQSWPGTRAEYTRVLIGTAIRHLLEVGLLAVPGDIEDRLTHPVAMGPVPSKWPGNGQA